MTPPRSRLERVRIAPDKPAVERIAQKVLFVGKRDKDALLVSLLIYAVTWQVRPGPTASRKRFSSGPMQAAESRRGS